MILSDFCDERGVVRTPVKITCVSTHFVYAAEVWVNGRLCCFGCAGVALQDWLKRRREVTDRVRRRS